MMDLAVIESEASEALPCGWSERKLQDVAQLINGRGFKPFEWDTTGLPIIRIQNLNGADDFNYYSGRYDPKIEVDPGQLLFAWSGSRGTSFGPHIWNGPKGVLNYHTWKVRVNAGAIVPSFFFHVLKHLTRIIEDQAHGASALVHVQKWEMEKFPFQCPNAPKEQEAIAEALSDADALIEGLERLIAKKRLIKQGAMQDLLTAKRRLPGFSGEWVEKPIGDIGPFVGGGTPSMAREDFWKDGTIPWVSSSDVRIGELRSADRMITLAAVKGSSTRVVESNSILFVTRSGILRRFQPVMINTVPVAINQDIKALLPRVSEYSPRYIFHAAVAAGERILRDCMKTGTTVESIDLNALCRFEIGCPRDLDEQRSIADVLTAMDAEIQALETRLDKARQVKEGMMQNLLTGRIRLV